MNVGKAGLSAVFILFLALGVVYSWPLALYPFDGIPYGYDANPAYSTARLYEGDHLQSYYHTGLLKHAVTGLIPWFTNPLEFAANPDPGRVFLYNLPLSLLYLPVSFYSMPLAYNFLVILSFGLGGVSMFLWAGWLTRSMAGGLVAAIIFNFFPIRLVELFGGHPSGFSAFLFPLTLYFVDQAVSRRSAKDGAIAGLFAVITAIEYVYFSYYLLMFLMVYLPWRILPAIGWPSLAEGGWANFRRIAFAGTPLAIGLAASIGWMLILKRMISGATFSQGGRTVGEVNLFSSPVSAMWETSHGWQVYAGVALIGAVFGLVYGLLASARRETAKWNILFFTTVFAVTYILAFGFTLDKFVPLYSFFYNHFPYFNLSRNPAKIMIIAMTALSVLGGYMAAWLARDKNWGTVAAMIFALAVGINFHPKKAIGICLLDEGNETYSFLAKQIGGRPILNLPVWPGEASWESIYEYYAVQTGVPMINGYSPVVDKEHTEKVFWPLFPMNAGDVGEEQYRRLKELNVSFVVFHADAYPRKVSPFSPYFALERLKRSPYLSLVKEADPLWVFAIREKSLEGPNPEIISPMALLFQMESQPRIKGQVAKDVKAANGEALAGLGPDPQEGGDLLNAGPYVTLPSGRYAVTFRVKARDKTDGPMLRLDVAAQEGANILAVRELTGADFPDTENYHDVTLEFTLAPGKPWQVEFRSYRLGAPEVLVDNAYLRFAGIVDPEYRFEAEDLFYYSGRLVKNYNAGGGEMIRSTPGLNPADVMVFGPGRMYAAGDYRLKARVKVDAGKLGDRAGRIEVISGNTQIKLAETAIIPNSDSPKGEFIETVMDFNLTQQDTVEAKFYFDGISPLAVDYMEIIAASIKMAE